MSGQSRQEAAGPAQAAERGATGAVAVPRIVTTSWDDGHPEDERVAELLLRHGMAATMYVPARCDRPVCDRAALRRLLAAGCELGGHTLTHARLKHLPDAEALREIADGKAWLENECGQEVSSFAYTWGEAPQRIRRLVQQAGFARARTIRCLRTDVGADPYCIPVTVQIYSHGRGAHLRHALREGNWHGLGSWFRLGLPGSLLVMLERAVQRVEREGGVIHLWGHGWELGERHLWPLFEQAVTLLARRPGWSYLTNAQADRALRAEGGQ
jgi:peptidoglycan/xylan/chitin deacetylase (PgdA/CDA1 family)